MNDTALKSWDEKNATFWECVGFLLLLLLLWFCFPPLLVSWVFSEPHPLLTHHISDLHTQGSGPLLHPLHLTRIWTTAAEEEMVPNGRYLTAKCRLPCIQLPALFELISFPKSGSSVFPVFRDYSYFSSVYFFHLSQLRSFLLLATKWFIIKNDSKVPVLSRIRLPEGRARINVCGSAHCGSPRPTKNCPLATGSYFSRNLLSTSGWLFYSNSLFQ